MNAATRRRRALLRDRRRDNRDENLYGPPLIRALTGWDLYISAQYAELRAWQERGLLPICQRPVQLHPNPTMWASEDDARDWIARILRGEYIPKCCYTIGHHVQCPEAPR
ncbi:hypothetical protein ACIRD9_42635 [Streptomyces violaceus]|uniref:hypothetical protein n=1 Tax=Streptomyces violaceus TaxID=1936 RepID=UPI0038188016